VQTERGKKKVNNSPRPFSRPSDYGREKGEGRNEITFYYTLGGKRKGGKIT